MYKITQGGVFKEGPHHEFSELCQKSYYLEHHLAAQAFFQKQLFIGILQYECIEKVRENPSNQTVVKSFVSIVDGFQLLTLLKRTQSSYLMNIPKLFSTLEICVFLIIC